MLEKLHTQYGNLIRALAAFEVDKRLYLDKADEVRDYIAEQLFGFGMKSCPPISGKTFADLPSGLGWVLRAEHWRELTDAVSGTTVRMPMLSLAIFVAVAVLLLVRGRTIAVVEETGIKIRRISSDRYSHTAVALAGTLLLVAPLPLLIGFTAWSIGQAPAPSDWLRSIGHGIGVAGWIILVAGFLSAVCRPRGLGAAHFQGRTEFLAHVRRLIRAFTVVYIPAMLLTVSCMFGDASQYLDSVGQILYCLALRWLMIKQRRLALAEALERRRARLEEAASHEQHEAGGEAIPIDSEDEQEMDLDSISEQTQALLQMMFGLGILMTILLYWSQTFPLIGVADSVYIPLTGGLTLLDLGGVLLIGIVTWVAVRNLPGLLEVAVLRATSIHAGTRNAITTLCQYGVTAIGLTLLLNILRVDWANLGWIAAALSVGLGFGLQEVVANFVCGLILLFERPIRVGDVVTLENMTGTVTKINLRATTITNWDRQELVVPNKSLITGTILNWTLSASVNRIVVPVGVAYGSNTDKARQILLDVAADHPRILDEPAPLATFEQFAQSSLNLVLRAYLPDLDSRLQTITELHTEIKNRFAAAGIEIAFPQQDIHLRSGWDGLVAAR